VALASGADFGDLCTRFMFFLLGGIQGGSRNEQEHAPRGNTSQMPVAARSVVVEEKFVSRREANTPEWDSCMKVDDD